VLKAAARIVPGVTIVLGANADARRIERLADRAIRHYRRIDNRSLNSA
jgi:hypothetical protein